jgi:hypothetical protein
LTSNERKSKYICKDSEECKAFKFVPLKEAKQVKRTVEALLVCMLVSFVAIPSALAQFSASVQGTVADPSGASVPKARVQIQQTDTGVTRTMETGTGGQFSFGSLAPGSYQITIVAKGFADQVIDLSLTTGEPRNVSIAMRVAGSEQTVTVSARVPVLDPGDSRLQTTIESKELHSLPLQGQNYLGLTAMAPGVTGLGITVGTDSTNGMWTNGSGTSSQIPDNFATELPVDASANGRSLLSNMFIVDGLDVTSDITGGVTNLSPNPDSVQEFTVETNTFSVQYGRAGSIIAMTTTKGGTNQFHGDASYFFTDQHLWARTPFTGPAYAPFKSNNISGAIGGPIVPHKQSYFFFSIEPLRSTFSTGSQAYTFEDPQFVTYAAQQFPGSLGTELLQKYPIKPVSNRTVLATGNDIFPGTCGTSDTGNIPCSLPMIDQGSYAASPYRNAIQFNTRIDQDFGNDRLYGNFYRMVHDDQAPSVRTDMDSTSHYDTNSLQVNETHTFNSHLLNEGMFGFLRMQGIINQTGPFSVPVANVVGQGTGLGIGFSEGNFIQHNYRWRDVATFVHGSHSIKVGYEGWHGDDQALFAGVYSHPSFDFNNLLDLVQDNAHDESSLSYDPITGKPTPGQYLFDATIHGVFVEDTWQALRNLTVTAGLRWDSFGNPYPTDNTILANFFLGSGGSQQEKVGNGSAIQVNHVFNHAITGFSPRIGVAWDPTRQGKWVVRGGVGLYRDWPTLGTDENNLKGNPPGFVLPTFLTGTTAPPVFAQGTSNTFPYGYTYPSLPSTTLDDHGGLAGAQLTIGGIDPNLRSPRTVTFVVSVQHEFPYKIVASAGYSGSRSNQQLTGSQFNQAPGTDINRFAGDLIVHNNVLTRLNNSFGAINYTTNGNKGSYNAFIASVQRRFQSGSVSASYTRSVSMDYGQQYPDQNIISQYWQSSAFDVPNRFSFQGNYTIPVPKYQERFVNGLLGGWGISGTSVAQDGLPFTVYTSAPFQPQLDDSGNVIGLLPGSGDYNADGYNYDWPNVNRKYSTSTSHQDYLIGLFGSADFSVPTMGSEGNESPNRFRGPGFFNVDMSAYKRTPITESTALELRFEFFNLFNRMNLNQVDGNLADGTFGRSTSAFNPRWVQLGAKFTF